MNELAGFREALLCIRVDLSGYNTIDSAEPEEMQRTLNISTLASFGPLVRE
jgi:hypothetical protein